MIYYVPLEPCEFRYTMQWSAAQVGWIERRWLEADIDYFRVEGERTVAQDGEIGAGVVLDAVGRTTWAFSQIKRLLEFADGGALKKGDVIYFDDFWHPGIEALPYAFDQMGLGGKIKMFSFLHAQSVDEYDFTAPMAEWMRPFERGIGKIMDGIFVAHPMLKDLVVKGGIAPKDKVYVTGHPVAVDEIAERMPWANVDFTGVYVTQRENKVVFSSRLDKEKNPKFLREVISRVLHGAGPGERKFVICSGFKDFRSNDSEAYGDFKYLKSVYGENFEIKLGCTKEEYYKELATAKVQFNCSLQDWFSITLFETSVAGCYPIYPNFRSFPLALGMKNLWGRDFNFLYNHLNAADAVNAIHSILSRDDLWTEKKILSRGWIHERFEDSWEYMLKVMLAEDPPHDDFCNPYSLVGDGG